MKKYIYKITAQLALVVLFTSCSDYLDVQPDDKILEEQAFSSEYEINNTFNGIYLNLSKANSYGRQLTLESLEILGQQYNVPIQNTRFQMANYNYADADVKKSFDDIWSTSYKTILQVNNFLSKMGNNVNVSANKADLMKGEAYAIRALLHFDMLRLYGPIYQTNKDDASIPYYTESDGKVKPRLPATEVVTKVLADLDLALGYLANDPIITKGPAVPESNVTPDFYSSSRNFRMNYYAVKALKARVLLYSGNNALAYQEAISVIDKASVWFPWSVAPVNPVFTDRIYYSEVLFGIYNKDLYNHHANLFASSLTYAQIFAPNTTRLDAVYESFRDNDYRYNPIWKIPTTGGFAFKTFFKYEDVSNKNERSRYMLPLLKISEMYLIAAETDPNPVSGLKYLNILRSNKGLVPLAPTANLILEVKKEYRKEFYGEGQLFFYYKRTNTASIDNGSTTNSTISMSAVKYVVPIPDSELNFN